jgi:hypothetical protein
MSAQIIVEGDRPIEMGQLWNALPGDTAGKISDVECRSMRGARKHMERGESSPLSVYRKQTESGEDSPRSKRFAISVAALQTLRQLNCADFV